MSALSSGSTQLALTKGRPVNLFYAIYANPATGYLTVGDTVQSHYQITPLSGDVNPTNNVEIIVDTVRAGCDPNNMTVSPTGCTVAGPAPIPLKYTISFVNTGTDTAFNIYIMDTLSPYLNVKSMNMVMSSATMFISQLSDAAGDNILKFDFPGVNLLDSVSNSQQCSSGVIFDINTRSGLPAGTQVFNHAGIFFDNNPVVMTNTVENIIGCIDNVPTVINNNNLQISPNPATNVLLVTSTPNTSLTITNAVGQVFRQQIITATQTTVNIADLPPGLYYIICNGENGNKAEKFVKM